MLRRMNIAFLTTAWCCCMLLSRAQTAGTRSGDPYTSLRVRLTHDSALRRQLVRTTAELLGKSLLSGRIELAGNVLGALQKTQDLKPFGVTFSIGENIQILLQALRYVPRSDPARNYGSAPRGFGAIIPGLDFIRRIFSKDRGAHRMDTNDMSLVVRTTEGLVRGFRNEQFGVRYISFLEIPYAVAPKRFRAPKPPRPWAGIRNANAETTFCPQKLALLNQVAGNEDCLYMNIHTPTLKAKNQPVFVWVHGGGFSFGLGNSYLFNPHKLVEQGLIVVSFNYRLGALGFLSTGTKEAPGNAGMKDIVAALRWIQNNIHNFGGDPKTVTLYGVSSGSVIVEYLMMSPMSKGLFFRAIMNSGSIYDDFSYQRNPLRYAFRLGRYLGSNATHVRDLVRFLKRVRPLDLVEASEKIQNDADPSGEYLPFVPVAEESIPGEEPFLLDHPGNILKSGQYYHVPTMIGFNDLEGAQFLQKINQNPDYLFSFDRNLEFYVPTDLLDGIPYPNQRKDLLNKVREFYFNGRTINNDTVRGAVDMLSDTKFLYGVYKSVKARVETSTAPTYYSEFAFDGDLSSFKYYNKIGVTGVSHADDLGYVFTLPYAVVYSENNSTTNLVSYRVVTMMANFVRYGDPTPTVTNLLPIKWIPIRSTETFDYLRITDQLEMKTNPNENRYTFWSTLFMYKKYLMMNND